MADASDLLSGIWLYTNKDVHRESEWLYRIANLYIDNIGMSLGGRHLSIPKEPRRLGFHTYGIYFGADMAQCLRYARGEADMSASYLSEIEANLSRILNTRVLDLVELDITELRSSAIPAPEIDWGPIDDRPLAQIIQAAQGRLALEKGDDVPSPLASALTGWTPQKIGMYSDDDVKMSSERSGGVTRFDNDALDHLVQQLEAAFFDPDDYQPL